jgi:hypothetical protein
MILKYQTIRHYIAKDSNVQVPYKYASDIKEGPIEDIGGKARRKETTRKTKT